MNKLAQEVTAINQRQMATAWQFKLNRVMQIRKYRRLYNGQVEPKLRIQFNVPIPIFAGMIDTLQADLDDAVLLKFCEEDPADYKAITKANAVLERYSTSKSSDNNWMSKFRAARQEEIITGRGFLKCSPSNEDGFRFILEAPTYEDMFWEPTGGPDLEKHLFKGQQNIWLSEKDLEDGKGTLYDTEAVNSLLNGSGSTYKRAGIWDSYLDFANRYRPLGLYPDANNYVGQRVWHFVEFVSQYKGKQWYNLFDPYSGTSIRFEKLTDINSSGVSPWVSFASHEDPKNFASKSFADDLYPIADSIITLFNQDLTNRQKRNLNAKAYDKDMVKDVQKFDEAQYRPDALVPIDTLKGTRRLDQAFYEFKTPEITGTIEMTAWLEQTAGRNLGVSDLQQGNVTQATKKPTVVYTEQANINKRLSFMSEPFLIASQQLGLRFFNALQDYMTEPMAVKLIGEEGVEWDVFKRKDLNLNKTPSINVVSKSAQDQTYSMAQANKEKALAMLGADPTTAALVNPKVKAEYIARDIGGFEQVEVALLLDTKNETSKETVAEASAAIQDIILRGKMPSVNYNADKYFLDKITNFARDHRDTMPLKKFQMLIDYAAMHQQIAMENEMKKAPQVAMQEAQSMMQQPQSYSQPNTRALPKVGNMPLNKPLNV